MLSRCCPWLVGVLFYLRLFKRRLWAVTGAGDAAAPLLPTLMPGRLGAPMGPENMALHGLPSQRTIGSTTETADDWNSWSESAKEELATPALVDRESRQLGKIDSLFAEMAPEYQQPRKARNRFEPKTEPMVGATGTPPEAASRFSVDDTYLPTGSDELGDWPDEVADDGAWGANDLDVSDVLKEKKRQEREERRRQHEQKLKQLQSQKKALPTLAARKLGEKTK